MTKKEEMELWEELEEMGFMPEEVKVLPECASFVHFDHHGNEIWRGVSGKEYIIIK